MGHFSESAIDVNVLPCLPGTYLSQQSHVCECDNSIKNAVVSCNGTGVVIKEGNSWIGPNYNNCTDVVYHMITAESADFLKWL